MVLGSSMPATGGAGQEDPLLQLRDLPPLLADQMPREHRRLGPAGRAINELLETVKGRIDRLVSDPLKTLREENWAKECELTRVMTSISARCCKVSGMGS